MYDIHRLPSNAFIIIFAIITCGSMMVFEAGQQLYFVRRYEISEHAQFLDLLFSQSRKWLVWMVFAIPLWWHIKRVADHDALSPMHIFQTIGLIVLMLFGVIVCMSVIEILMTGDAMTAHLLWREYAVFYTFQKVPIYLFGYTFLSLVFYLHSKNNQLTVQVLKLSELTQKDLNMYYQHQASKDQNTSVLKIKVGNSYKIVSIEDIDWIEADDYCVNIHCHDHDRVYSMRATLKSLEALLPNHFLRVHRSAIVNMQGVEAYQTKGSGLITLKTGEEIAVAQSKVKLIKDFFAVEHG